MPSGVDELADQLWRAEVYEGDMQHILPSCLSFRAQPLLRGHVVCSCLAAARYEQSEHYG